MDLDDGYVWPDDGGPLDDDEPDDVDLGMCPFYVTSGNRDLERGLCAYGCHSEPACQTCEPEGGWPSYEQLTAEEKDVLRAKVGAAARRTHEEFLQAIRPVFHAEARR